MINIKALKLLSNPIINRILEFLNKYPESSIQAIERWIGINCESFLSKLQKEHLIIMHQGHYSLNESTLKIILEDYTQEYLEIN